MQNETKKDMSFQSEDSWIVQCLSLAAIGVLGYLQIAPAIIG